MRKLTGLSRSENRQGTYLGYSILAMLVLPHVRWLVVGFSNVQNWEKALWSLLMAAVLVSAYFFREATFLFRAIVWVFQKFHVPRGDWIALIYGAFFLVYSLLYVFGVMDTLTY